MVFLVDNMAFNTAREKAVYNHLKTIYKFDAAKDCGEWVNVNLFFEDNEMTLTYVRAKGGIVECVLETKDGKRGKANFSMLTEDGELQQVEYYALLLLCNHFGLFFRNSLCLN